MIFFISIIFTAFVVEDIFRFSLVIEILVWWKNTVKMGPGDLYVVGTLRTKGEKREKGAPKEMHNTNYYYYYYHYVVFSGTYSGLRKTSFRKKQFNLLKLGPNGSCKLLTKSIS